MLLKLFSFFLPWKLRRIFLEKVFGFKIHKSAKIGLAWVFPLQLEMGENSRISHFTVAIHLDKVTLGKNAIIDRSNWITGFPSNSSSASFKHRKDRKPELIIGNDSAITKNHHIDCTDLILIGNFVTIAGYNTQLLTHSVDVYHSIQDCKPITIGDYAFVGTNCTILGGTSLPAYSVLGAKSLLTKSYTDTWTIYGGVPAKPLSTIDKSAKYFRREVGSIE